MLDNDLSQPINASAPSGRSQDNASRALVMNADDKVPWYVVGIFHMNIIVGTGCLSLPLAFASAGVVLGSLFTALLAGFSVVTMWYLVEAQSVCTAVRILRDSRSPLEARRIARSGSAAQMDQLASMFTLLLPRWGSIVWYSIVVIYLIGDLAVYAVYIPDTISKVVSDTPDGERVAYQVSLLILAVVVTPLVFFSLKKTTALQLITTVVRHSMFLTMIIAALAFIPKSPAHFASAAPVPSDGTVGGFLRGTAAYAATTMEDMGYRMARALVGSEQVPGCSDSSVVLGWRWGGLSLLFGSTLYAQISQHYVPSMYAGISDRSHIRKTVVLVAAVVVAYYLVLSWSMVMAFQGQPCNICSASSRKPCGLQQIATQNFGYLGPVGGMFVFCAPLLSLLSSFPIIAITLRDNLMCLAHVLSDNKLLPIGVPPQLSHEADLDAAAADGLGLINDLEEEEQEKGAEGDARKLSGPSFELADNHDEEEEEEVGPLLEDATTADMHALAKDLLEQSKLNPPEPPSPGKAPLVLRVIFALIACVPSFILAAAFGKDVNVIVEVTGAYGGAFLMLVGPVLLTIYARMISQAVSQQQLQTVGGASEHGQAAWRVANDVFEAVVGPTRSPLAAIWPGYAAMAFAGVAIIVNTVTFIVQGV